MKALGLVFIVAGILMCIFTSINFTQEKNIVDLGPLQINKKENKTIGWPVYAGIAVTVLGVALVVMDKKAK